MVLRSVVRHGRDEPCRGVLPPDRAALVIPSGAQAYGDGFVMDAAFAGNVNLTNGAELAQVFQALAGGAFAQPEPFD